MMSIFSPRSSDTTMRPRAARADAGADRVDALGVRLDGDLRAVAGSRATPDLDEAVGDLRHLELEERRDELGSRRERITCGPFVPERTSVMTALMRLPARSARRRPARSAAAALDLAEVDEHVVAVARLLDDAGHDLALAVDVLLVHHRALGLADALLDDLLRGLRGDAAEVVGVTSVRTISSGAPATSRARGRRR
jgi:hypothetical protein